MTEYEYLRLELNKDIESKAKFIASGNCQNFEEYKYVTGVIRGLTLAADLIKDREQKVEASDE
jgi:hypothetical protein